MRTVILARGLGTRLRPLGLLKPLSLHGTKVVVIGGVELCDAGACGGVDECRDGYACK